MNKKYLTIAILSTLASSSAYALGTEASGMNFPFATSLNTSGQGITNSTEVGNNFQGSETTINGENIYIGTNSTIIQNSNMNNMNNMNNMHYMNSVYIGSPYGGGTQTTQYNLYLNGDSVATSRDMMNLQDNFQTSLQQNQSEINNMQNNLQMSLQQNQSMQNDLQTKVTQTAINNSMHDAGLSTNAFSVNANGKISNNNVNNGSQSLTVLNNQTQDTHGFYVDQTVAVMSGGTHSTSFTLDDNGATLSNSQTGAPVQLHGVANGTAANDAVNFSQLNTLDQKVDKNATRAFSGIAQIAAMQAIPAPIAGKNYSIGMGGGFYAGQQAMAFGGKANVGEHLNVSASVANGFGSNKDMAASVGAGFSW